MRLLNTPAKVTLTRNGALTTIAWAHPAPRTPADRNTRPRRVLNVIDQWRYDGRWWEERPLGRDYYLVELEGGTQAELFRENDDWCITRIAD